MRDKFTPETAETDRENSPTASSHRKSYSVNIGRISTHSNFVGNRHSRNNLIEVSENFKFEKNKLIYYQTLK